MDPSPATPPLPNQNHLKRPLLLLPHSSSKLPKSEGGGSSPPSARPEDEGAAMNPHNHPRVQRYLVAIEYIGTRFSGSQKQLNCRTVVGVLEEAFEKLVGRPVSIFCSSRTLPPHEPGVVHRAVNHFLQKKEGDIMITDVRCVEADFHARYQAKERTYFYRLLSGPEPISTFEKDRAWHIPDDLNILSMQEACRILLGHHDFSSFRASGCQANSPVRTLDELHITEVATSMYFPSVYERRHTSCIKEPPLCSSSQEIDATVNNVCTAEVKSAGSKISRDLKFGQRRRHRCYIITTRARSFLYHQVRLLVGVLKCVGTGELTVPDGTLFSFHVGMSILSSSKFCSLILVASSFSVERILKAKTVTAAKPMAPACGLYLGHVEYDLP